jgi:hypothetical protein
MALAGVAVDPRRPDQVRGEAADPEAGGDGDMAGADQQVRLAGPGRYRRRWRTFLANLPPRVRVTWPHHELAGSELELHGWQHVDAEIHLWSPTVVGSRHRVTGDTAPADAAHETGPSGPCGGIVDRERSSCERARLRRLCPLGR